ncbi:MULTISPECIES: response regulator transcription factor [Flavobacterium]|uniref:response regulator n=1 Tax=Flavobacterium TaxID=237 RepID=UPI00086CCF32|nr:MULTISPECIES: response regulator transcription factor [Flavobacterium]MBN9282888.1 response regulator transcription factor [Flavobacterium sp.]ODS85856.1 MAG: DNA-binding response regulator [Chryseobacterium sp. SCN 40-13]OJV67529.1 MAG: DNA-binding response regulator [Flavobacterium sp. 40-81]
MNKIKIVIVDDHLLFSQSLSFLINSFKEFVVAGNYNNGKDFLTGLVATEELPDLVLLDVNMPVMDGVETMKRLKENYPELRVLALSVNDDEDTIIKMISNGATGYLLKDTHPAVFREALLKVHETGYFYTEMVSGVLINKLGAASKASLKEREIEFIKLACTEMTYREIADEMCLSPKTVDGYRENLFQKLEIKTRIGLVLYAMKNKIVCI